MLKGVLHLVAKGRKNVKVSFSRWVLVRKPAGFSMTKNDNERLQLEEDVNSLKIYVQLCTGAWSVEKHLYPLKSLNCTEWGCTTLIRKNACSYGRPAKKRRPARGLEDPIGSRTRHDFIIAWSMLHLIHMQMVINQKKDTLSERVKALRYKSCCRRSALARGWQGKQQASRSVEADKTS